MDSLVLVLERNECHFTRANVDYAISTDPLEWLDGTFYIIKQNVSFWCEFILMLMLPNITLSQPCQSFMYYNCVINSLIIRKTLNTNIAIHN